MQSSASPSNGLTAANHRDGPAEAGPGPNLLVELEHEARRLGFARFGIAPASRPPHHDAFRGWLARRLAGVMEGWLARHEPLRADPRWLLPGARSVVMLAFDHAIEPPASPPRALTEPSAPGQGRVARYAWGDDYHDLLRSRANQLADWLIARTAGAARAVVDSAPLAERDFAWLAGLGWYGKNTMLIHPRAGSYFLLAAILTDIDLPPTTTVLTDHCGTCTACLEACPTGALLEPGVLDANRCISSLTIEDHGPIAKDLRSGMGDWVFGCDLCQEACPWNRHAPGSTEPALQPREGATTLALADLLALDEAGFRARYVGSPLSRAKRRGLLRSAAIALGNRPDPAAMAALSAALADPEPGVRGAAAWALGRWIEAGTRESQARVALEARLSEETDPEVLDEIASALEGGE
jgi:epoxyqueuosine reductase